MKAPATFPRNSSTPPRSHQQLDAEMERNCELGPVNLRKCSVRRVGIRIKDDAECREICGF